MDLARLPALALLGLGVLTTAPSGQEDQGAPEDEESAAEPESDDPRHAVEFAISGDALWLAYRNALHRGGGYTTLGLLINEDDDFALQGRIMRFGEPTSRLALGAGLGLFGARVDEDSAEVGAITLTGAAEAVLELHYPLRLGLEASYAPNAATVGEGERVLDLLARLETDLSDFGTAFVGWRRLEVDLDDGDKDLDQALQIGLRLGF